MQARKYPLHPGVFECHGRQIPDSRSATLGTSIAIGEIDQARSSFTGDEPLAAAFESLVPEMSSAEGALLLVTHDRRMLTTVRLDRRWHIEAGTVTELV